MKLLGIHNYAYNFFYCEPPSLCGLTKVSHHEKLYLFDLSKTHQGAIAGDHPSVLLHSERSGFKVPHVQNFRFSLKFNFPLFVLLKQKSVFYWLGLVIFLPHIYKLLNSLYAGDPKRPSKFSSVAKIRRRSAFFRCVKYANCASRLRAVCIVYND
jgi:hypothetical protein